MKVKFTVSLPYHGSNVEETIELGDDWTNADIQAYYELWQSEQVDGGWERVDE